MERKVEKWALSADTKLISHRIGNSVKPGSAKSIRKRRWSIRIRGRENGGAKIWSAPQRLPLRRPIRSPRWLRSTPNAFLPSSLSLTPPFLSPLTVILCALQFFKIQLFSLTSVPPDLQQVSLLLLFSQYLPIFSSLVHSFIIFSADLWLSRWSPSGHWLRSRQHFRQAPIGGHRRPTWTATGRFKRSECSIHEIRRGVGQALAGLRFYHWMQIFLIFFQLIIFSFLIYFFSVCTGGGGCPDVAAVSCQPRWWTIWD